MSFAASIFSRPRRNAIVAGPPTHYIVTSSSYSPAAGSNVTITAQLADANGIFVHTAGLTVTWSKSGTGGSFSAGTSVTDANGRATVTFTTDTTIGATTTITATDGTPYTGTSATITGQAVPTSYSVTAANYSPIEGTDDVITAQLLDQNGNPLALAGRLITWTTGAGSLSSPTSLTDASGIATVTVTCPATIGTVFEVFASDTGFVAGHTADITTQAGAGPDTNIEALIAPADGGDGILDAGQVDLYAGTMPRSTLDSVPAGATLLGSFPLNDPTAPLANLVASNQITLDLGQSFVFQDDAGTADKFVRIRKSDGSVLADQPVHVAATDITIGSDTVTTGQTLTLTLTATA